MSDHLGDAGPVDELSSDSRFSPSGQSRTPSSLAPGAKLTALTTALAVVLTGGVVTAAWRSFRSHDGPESLMPASTFAAGSLDLSMRGQDDALAAFADHFPSSPTHHGDGSAVDRLLRAIFRSSSDPHVDYDRDIKPWLGDHVALAGWIDKAGKPEMEGLIESTDDAAARQELRKLMNNGDGAFSLADGYVVLGDTPALVQQSIDAAHHSSLADDSRYAADIDALPGQPALTGWVDGPAARKAIKAAMSPDEAKMFERMGPMGPLGMFGPMGLVGAAGSASVGSATAGAFGSGSPSFSGRTALGVRVDDRYLELDSRSTGASVQHESSTSTLRALPSSTIAAFELGDPSSLVTGVTAMAKTFSDFGAVGTTCVSTGAAVAIPGAVPMGAPHRRRLMRELAREQRQLQRQSNLSPSRCSTQHVRPPDPLQEIEKASGLQLPGDATTVLGDSLLASYGGLTLHGMPKVAVRTHPADLSAAQAVLDKVRSRLGGAGVPLTVDTSGDDLVLATSGDYAHDVEQAGSFGEQAQVRLALGDLPSSVGAAGYVDLARILPLLGSVPSDVQALKAVGFWTTLDGSVQTSQLRLVVG